jgi:hypothetical protein
MGVWEAFMKRAARPLEDFGFKPIGLALAAVVAGVAPAAQAIESAHVRAHGPDAKDAAGARSDVVSAAARRQGELFDL